MSGGAWKVAYADFVTAMMALFMVLWILGAEQDILMELQDYFRNPPSPWESETSKYLIETGEHMGFSAEDEARDNYFNSPDPAILQGIVDEFNKLLQSDMNDVPPPVKMTLTSDGLRMVIFDRDDSPMFLPRGVDLTDWGMFLLQNIAWLLSRYEFEVSIESHCEPDMPVNANYGPWELTTDRSNKIRRKLQHYAGGEVGIGRVSGYGASQPVDPDESEASDFPPIHQRVIISMNLPDPTALRMDDAQETVANDAEPTVQSDDLLKITEPVL
jgi:chemotaxis protein MotB